MPNENWVHPPHRFPYPQLKMDWARFLKIKTRNQPNKTRLLRRLN